MLFLNDSTTMVHAAFAGAQRVGQFVQFVGPLVAVHGRTGCRSVESEPGMHTGGHRRTPEDRQPIEKWRNGTQCV